MEKFYKYINNWSVHPLIFVNRIVVKGSPFKNVINKSKISFKIYQINTKIPKYYISFYTQNHTVMKHILV